MQTKEELCAMGGDGGGEDETPFMKMDGFFQIHLNLRVVCEFSYWFYCVVKICCVRVMVLAFTLRMQTTLDLY